MTTAASSIYGMFIACVVSTAFGITTLILDIVFKYIGFVESDVVLSGCTNGYMLAKFKYLTLQLEASFIGILVGLLMDIIALVLIILAIKNLRSFTYP